MGNARLDCAHKRPMLCLAAWTCHTRIVYNSSNTAGKHCSVQLLSVMIILRVMILKMAIMIPMIMLIAVGLMRIWGCAIEQISLAALIIALGMIVDDIIVVSDLYLVKLSRGMDRTEAAIEAADENAKPLLWATTAAAFALDHSYSPIISHPSASRGRSCDGGA